MASFSYPSGTALAGLLDGALAGHMGRQANQLLLQQITDELAAYDAGKTPAGFPNLIGFYTTFDGRYWSRDSQVARLRDGKTKLAAMLA